MKCNNCRFSSWGPLRGGTKTECCKAVALALRSGCRCKYSLHAIVPPPPLNPSSKAKIAVIITPAAPPPAFSSSSSSPPSSSSSLLPPPRYPPLLLSSLSVWESSGGICFPFGGLISLNCIYLLVSGFSFLPSSLPPPWLETLQAVHTPRTRPACSGA